MSKLADLYDFIINGDSFCYLIKNKAAIEMFHWQHKRGIVFFFTNNMLK